MAGQKNGQEQDINQLRKVRREKLANLQEAGKDPFQITKYDRSVRCLPQEKRLTKNGYSVQEKPMRKMLLMCP